MALAESEEKFRSFVENANDIIYEMTAGGMFTYVSPKVTEQLGYDPGEVLGASFSSFIHPDDLETCRRFAQETITTGVKKSGLEYRIRHRNGSWQWHSTTTSPIRDADGRIVALLGICRDITERKTTERALRLANKKLGLLVGITRHDIRNQLLALKGYLAVSKDALGDPDLLASYIASEERIADTIAHQIDFSRDYNELGAGAPTWQNLHRIVTGVAARLPVGAVRVDAGDPKLEVLADPLLEKVFYNLFDNALKYGKGMITAIRVSARTAGENLVLSVEDDGGGIGAGEKTRIFEKGVGKNTGLGLYLSREILSITGIAITENGEPGKGARFEMTVPAGMFRFACR
ncbi:MAG: PAS domain S-box protein [Methanomicrobiales archaeon]|nr:PAS domain S-box protein [Methanomicrobiales archaeon]